MSEKEVVSEVLLKKMGQTNIHPSAQLEPNSNVGKKWLEKKSNALAVLMTQLTTFEK